MLTLADTCAFRFVLTRDGKVMAASRDEQELLDSIHSKPLYGSTPLADGTTINGGTWQVINIKTGEIRAEEIISDHDD